MEFASWDDEIPYIMETNPNVWNHQANIYIYICIPHDIPILSQ